MNIDPLADLVSQVDLSPYSFAWNNPIVFDDPTGLCPECEQNVKDPQNGATYTSSGGGNYTYNDGQWTRNDGELDEVVIGPSTPSTPATPSSSSEGMAGKIIDIGTDFIPIVGPLKDIYKGARDGNGLQLAMGVGFLVFDVATLGSASVVSGGVKTLGKGLIEQGSEMAMKEASSSLYHYTSEAGYKAIMESGQILPSIGVKNARHGPGKYLTDIIPGSLTGGQTSRRLFGVPWNKSKLTHFIEIDAKTLNVVKNAPNNYMVPGTSSLSLEGILKSHGTTGF